MAKIIVLAAMAAVLQLAVALTKPDCSVMEGEMFTVVTERKIPSIYGMAGEEDGLDCLRAFFPISACVAAAYVPMSTISRFPASYVYNYLSPFCRKTVS